MAFSKPVKHLHLEFYELELQKYTEKKTWSKVWNYFLLYRKGPDRLMLIEIGEEDDRGMYYE